MSKMAKAVIKETMMGVSPSIVQSNLYYKKLLNKTAWYCYRDRLSD